MSTVTVTNMPFWAERVGTPRALAVEFPFGHTLGRPHDVTMQRRVLLHALALLERASGPETLEHFQEAWPATRDEGLRASHPATPPPIATQMGRHMGRLLMGLRREG